MSGGVDQSSACCYDVQANLLRNHMLIIRLQRTGSKNRPAFRLVLAEKEKSASKKFQEVLGHYNPRLKQFGLKSEERLKYWISQNVAMSPTAHNLLVEKKLLDAKKVKAWRPKKKEGAEAPQEAVPAAEAQSAPAPEAAAQPAPEAPATETPAA